jgi:hypothetical protein
VASGRCWSEAGVGDREIEFDTLGELGLLGTSARSGIATPARSGARPKWDRSTADARSSGKSRAGRKVKISPDQLLPRSTTRHYGQWTGLYRLVVSRGLVHSIRVSPCRTPCNSPPLARVTDLRATQQCLVSLNLG